MKKDDWFKLDKKEKAVYIEDTIDRLKSISELTEKRETEKALFQVIGWESEPENTKE